MMLPHLVLLFTTLGFVEAVYHRQNHFGNPCYLCECFVEYTDRDKSLAVTPYKVAKNGYDTTEDQCLAECNRDEKCKAAVYALIGGRSVFTCELYEEVNTQSLIYTPHANLYLKKIAKCNKSNKHLLPVEFVDADETIVERKRKYMKLEKKLNPFHHGRK